ncbi:hypothetical protein OH809_24480 [Streptomyces sp. NBC_00873]|nr:hypothetical protein OH809_24480 [Streptomyces sp. NBC_00873]WTA44418.1 hypothetical protein OH821_18810 [Streptomyces sp. NBC_00842]
MRGAIGFRLTGARVPFSDACLIAMDYGRESIVRDDWKNVFNDDELDKVITRMLKIKEIKR